MDIIDEVRIEIERLVKEREDRVLNTNALDALFVSIGGIFVGSPSGVIEGLRKVFFGRGEAIELERQKQTQQLILELVCKIDQALKDSDMAAKRLGETTLGGVIEVFCKNGDVVTGVSISPNSGPVIFQPGTRITTNTENVRRTTGLQIGKMED